MNIYFFTYVDDNPKYQKDAEYLIKSGKLYGRDIHLYHVPKEEHWNRYKMNLIAANLPKADRYVCLDSDTILTCKGDWDSPDCQGVMDILYFCPNERTKHTQGFIRNHTVVAGDGPAGEFIFENWRKMHCPPWCNSGVVVLDADIRKDFCSLWFDWQRRCDEHSNKGQVIGDEAACMFARAEFGLPLLPPRFNGCCKWQPIEPWHVLLHADGNVTGQRAEPFLRELRKINAKKNLTG